MTMMVRLLALALAFGWVGLLAGCRKTTAGVSSSDVQSLTGQGFTGKKYYLGWGAAGGGDPDEMQNEVKYDVLHTHDMFTSASGGQYLGTRLMDGQGRAGDVRQAWSQLKGAIGPQDMYVQYSSGHGSPQGLGIGVDYSEMADFALSLPAREVVIFTMACYSGGLVNELQSRKAEWQERAAQGRTLLVMSSSTSQETSSTGPGTDPSEQAGLSGSAGSAFGHALWKSITGGADGYLDGVQDGFISLGELVAFTTDRTREIGNHTPTYAGTFNPALIMNAAGATAVASAPADGTDKLTDQEIRQRVASLDRSLARVPVTSVRRTTATRADQGLASTGDEAIFVALIGRGQTQDALLVASGGPSTKTMEACVGLQGADCRAGVPGYVAFELTASVGGRTIFKASSPVTMGSGVRIAFSGKGEGQTILASRVIELRAKVAAGGGQVNPGTSGGGLQGGSLRLGDLSLTVPSGWTASQDASSGAVQFYSFASQNGDVFSIYAQKSAGGARKMFGGRGSQVTTDVRPEQKGARQWQVIDTQRTVQTAAREFQGKTYFVTGFWTEINGTTYCGYGRSEQKENAKRAVDAFLN